MQSRRGDLRWCALWLAALACSGAAAARGDVFLLRQGGQIRGHWLNPDERPRTHYQIQTAGGWVVLDADQVTEVVVDRPVIQEYERIAPSFADTPQAQWQLAEWCRQQYLAPQRNLHLQRILELDPDHAEARRALGYTYDGGRWQTEEERKRELGFLLYRGRWRLSQEIDLIEERRKRELAEKEWTARLVRWRDALAGERVAQVREQFLAIEDPAAVPALLQLMEREPFRAVRLLYVNCLGRIADGAGVTPLLRVSLNDPDIEVRLAALDLIAAKRPAGAAEQYIKALKDNNNYRVNRAAAALARLGDTSAISPLIDALVTTHTAVYTPPGAGSPDSITTSFMNSSGGSSDATNPFPSSGTGLATGNRSQTIVRQIPNQDVLAALVKLSGGANYSFDAAAWKTWHAAQQARIDSISARRD